MIVIINMAYMTWHIQEIHKISKFVYKFNSAGQTFFADNASVEICAQKFKLKDEQIIRSFVRLQYSQDISLLSLRRKRDYRIFKGLSIWRCHRTHLRFENFVNAARLNVQIWKFRFCTNPHFAKHHFPSAPKPSLPFPSRRDQRTF